MSDWSWNSSLFWTIVDILIIAGCNWVHSVILLVRLIMKSHIPLTNSTSVCKWVSDHCLWLQKLFCYKLLVQSPRCKQGFMMYWLVCVWVCWGTDVCPDMLHDATPHIFAHIQTIEHSVVWLVWTFGYIPNRPSISHTNLYMKLKPTCRFSRRITSQLPKS